MATFNDTIKENEANGQYWKCDECKKKITNNEIKLVDPIDNFKFLTPIARFTFVDKNGALISGSAQASKQEGDKVLACPYCNTIHLYGFDLWEE